MAVKMSFQQKLGHWNNYRGTGLMIYIWQSSPTINIKCMSLFPSIFWADLLKVSAKKATDLFAHAVSDCTNKLCYITECLYSEPGYFRTISKPFAFLNNWFDCWLAFVSLYWWSIYLFSSTFYLVPLNPREKSETPYYNWRRYSSSMPALAAIPHRVSFSKRGLLENTAEYLVTFSLSVVSGCLRALCLSTVLRQTF